MPNCDYLKNAMQLLFIMLKKYNFYFTLDYEQYKIWNTFNKM